MKFPEGGGLFRAMLLVEEPEGSREPPDFQNERLAGGDLPAFREIISAAASTSW
jgi:hypothetical protein